MQLYLSSFALQAGGAKSGSNRVLETQHCRHFNRPADGVQVFLSLQPQVACSRFQVH